MDSLNCVSPSVLELTVNQTVDQPGVPARTGADGSSCSHGFKPLMPWSHTLPYLLYRRNIRAYTAPPMHSGYRRYDRYFMAYRETGIPSTGNTLFNNRSVLSCAIVWVLDELKLTRVSYSSVLLSDSSDFPYCPQKTWKSQHR